MTDRIRHLTVTLDADYYDDDAERIIDAIQMIRGVESVEMLVQVALDLDVHEHARKEIRRLARKDGK